MTPEFYRWWDADELTQTNPYVEGTPAFWSWEGWQGAMRSMREQKPVAYRWRNEGSVWRYSGNKPHPDAQWHSVQSLYAAPVSIQHDDTDAVELIQVVDTKDDLTAAYMLGSRELRVRDEAMLRGCLARLESHTGNYKISKAESTFQDALVDELRNRLGDST